jgi:hypothetical protein
MYDYTPVDNLTFHHSMLVDEVRTGRFLQALLHTVQPGDVVLDIVSGTGILALFACLARARRVYAVEQSLVLEGDGTQRRWHPRVSILVNNLSKYMEVQNENGWTKKTNDDEASPKKADHSCRRSDRLWRS